MLTTTPATALWFLPFVIPIAVWVAWSDMKSMRIPNKAVMALAAVFLIIGPLALPLDVWAWRWTHLVFVLLIGFVANATGLIGAGDAKFAAAMAPFFAVEDLRFLLALFAAAILGAFVSHRLMKHLPPFRRLTSDWESWTHPDFPMGLTLAGTLVFYFLAVLTFAG